MPTLGATPEAILAAFAAESTAWCGRRIVEAVVVAGHVYRIDARGCLCVVVGEVHARDATPLEVADLRRQVALGHVQIRARTRRQFETIDSLVLHEAAGLPLDPESLDARFWQRRLDALERAHRRMTSTGGGR
jgi:hypothetical protein